jgi:hypothetical protein
MTRPPWWADEPDDDADDQFDFLNTITRAELLRQRPPGEKPLGPAEWFCQARVVVGCTVAVPCYGPLVYETDHIGRTVAVCQRSSCRAVHVIPRRVIAQSVRYCTKGHAITGENEGKSETGRRWCVICRKEKNERTREKDRAKRKALQNDERYRHLAAMRRDGKTLTELVAASGLSRSRVKQILASPRTNTTTTSDEAAA